MRESQAVVTESLEGLLDAEALLNRAIELKVQQVYIHKNYY